MRFKVKDLMISVPSQQQIPPPLQAQQAACCLIFTLFCTGCTNGCTCSGCSGGCSVCSAVCTACSGGRSGCGCTNSGPSHNCAVMDFGAEELAALKAELQRNMAQVEAQQQVMEQQLRPQTLEDVNLLEQKLQEALEELRARKVELQGATGQSQTDRPAGGPSQG